MKGSKQPCLSHKIAAILDSHKSRKHGPYCWYFGLNLKFPGWPYRNYIETAKKLLTVRIFFLFFILYSYCYSAKASQAVVKIATDVKDYRRCSLYIMVCIATAYQ